MTSPRVRFIFDFLIDTMALSVDELYALRETIGRYLLERDGSKRTLKRTLYLPGQPLDDLDSVATENHNR